MTDDPLKLVALLGADPEPTPRGEDIAHGRLLDCMHGLPDLNFAESNERHAVPERVGRRHVKTRPQLALLAGAMVLLIALLMSGWAGALHSSSPSGAARLGAAQQMVADLPYPPGQADTARAVLRTAQAPEGRTVTQQAQYRAWCKWLAYWLDRRAAGDTAGARAAAEVLAASIQWNDLRVAGEPARAVATATETGNVRSAQLLAVARCPTFI